LDIKPNNILFIKNENNVNPYLFKLTDFGLSQKFKQNDPKIAYRSIGTTLFMVPEMANESSLKAGYDVFKADVYGLGVTLAKSLS
jgi:serine/threonine protein kinase